MHKLRLLLKKIFCMVVLMATSLSSMAIHVQLEQISIKEGLNFQEITTLENYSDKCLWIGTSIGFNSISNGNITEYSYITINGSEKITGRVEDITSYSYNRVLIASENFLIEFNQGNKKFTPILYEGKDIITKSILILGEDAYFIENSTNSLLKYSFQSGIVSLVYQFDKSNQFLFSNILKPINSNDYLFLLDDTKGIFKINLLTKEVKKIEIVNSPIVSKASIVDSENNLWIVYKENGLETFSIDSGFKSVASYSKSNSKLDYEHISCLVELQNGDICIGTDGAGMYIIRKLSGKIDLKTHNLFDETTTMCLVGHNVVFGTPYHGLILARRSNFHLLNDMNLSNDNILSNNIALSAYDEGNGTIWFGTADGGINRYDEETDVNTSYISSKKFKIHLIKRFDENRLLLGTEHDGYLLFDKRTGYISDTFMDMFHDLKYDLQNNSVLITQDNKGDYLLFNVNGENYRYNPTIDKKEIFKLFSNEKTGIKEKVLKVTERDSYAVISTKRTISIIDYSDLSSKRIYSAEGDFTTFTIDPDGSVWFIDRDKLFSYDPETQLDSLVFSTPNGRILSSLTADNKNNIWVTSVGGLIYKYDKSKGTYSIYSKEDDVPMVNFLRSFALCSSTGRIYLPSTLGLLVVDAHDMVDREYVHRDIYTSSIIIDGESVSIPENGKLKIHNGYKSFEMEMAVNMHDPTVPVLMRLIMEKNGKEAFSSVTFKPIFSNNMLKPGKYTLKVQTLDFIGWSEPITMLEFKVKVPLFLSGPMLTFLFIFIVFSIWFISNARYQVKQRKIEQLLFDEATRQKESRIAFITSIAHELRTPLSLLYNPLKDIMNNKTPEDHDYDKLERIFAQVKRITNMVNIILDSVSRSDVSIASKIEAVDINEWFSHKLIEFHELSDQKKREMKFEPYPFSDKINIDLEVLETAFNNVISNAIKNSDSGVITISIKPIQNYIRISVADQGRGFKCNPEDLFKRFFRERSDVTGYGLGLPYAKTQLENIGGSISAEHNVGVGSVFNIDIPFELSDENSLSSYIEKVNEETIAEEDQSESTSFNTKDKVLMFVDDDSDLREYIKNEYQSLFKTVILAKDGKVALEKIKSSIPDVIVSDIMMPNMNGFDLCKEIKSNIEFSHLPVILLTSRTDSLVRMTSYKLGADAFIPKPFDFKELYKIIKSQLWNRYEIKRQYSQSLFSSMSEEQTFSAADEQFVLKLNKFINSNLSNLALDIEMISNHMNVSRSTLFNKMNELLGTSAVKYIRRLRVEASKKLLENTDKSILDIALECGFADSQYLSAVFKQETDETPSQYRKRSRKENTV